jgi:hypothetical protein
MLSSTLFERSGAFRARSQKGILMQNQTVSSFVAPDPASSPITYVLVRTDIPGSQQTVQAIHAAMGSAAKFGEPEHNHLALLAVPDQATLLSWGCRLRALDIGFHAFFEPDNEMGYSALSTAPLTREQGFAFRSLPLWSCPTISSDLSDAVDDEVVPTACIGMS